MPTDFELTCRRVGNLVEVLPHSLEQKAKAQLYKACGKISKKAQAKAKDLEQVARGELGLVSKETWKQVAELVKMAGEKLSAEKPNLPRDKLKPEKYKPGLVHDATKGQGSQKRVRLPIRFANDLDVHIMVNYDPDKIRHGQIDFLGAGLGATKKIGQHTSIDARVFVDTSEVRTNGGGSVLVTVEW